MNEIELVVFDVDGTLYDQRPLRRRMAVDLLAAVARGRERPGVVATLRAFRRQRERLADDEAEDVTRRQYVDVAQALGVREDEVRRAVRVWMHERPLRFLRASRARGIDALLRDVRDRRVTTAVLSDHRATTKLQALDLEVDIVVSAEDPEVDRFKPDVTGLERVMSMASVAPAATLVIGDRLERDGAIAARTGARFVLKVWRRPRGPDEVDDFATLVGRIGATQGAVG